MRKLITSIILLTTFVCFGTTTKVFRVIDGDTFETETGEKVRLIGINAPEISDIFGQEAKQHLVDLIQGKSVDLQTDNISKDRDRYNRLLCYVIIDNVDINKQMIIDGYAFAYLKYHFEKQEEYRQAQIVSNSNNSGIWAKSQKGNIIKQISDKESLWKSFPKREYFIITIVLILIFLGVYYYFKK